MEQVQYAVCRVSCALCRVPRAVWSYSVLIIAPYPTRLTKTRIPANNTAPSFLVVGLGFSNFALAMLTLLGNVGAYVALMMYKKYYFDVSWRKIYVVCTIMYLVFTSMQYILIFRLNDDWGMGDQGYLCCCCCCYCLCHRYTILAH